MLPAASVALSESRALAAIGGGLVTTVGLILYAAGFAGSEPTWWVGVLAGTLETLGEPGLGLGGRRE